MDLYASKPAHIMSQFGSNNVSANNSVSSNNTSATTAAAIAQSTINTGLNKSNSLVDDFAMFTTTSTPMKSTVSKTGASITTLNGALYTVIDSAIGLAIAHLRTFLKTPAEQTWHGKAIAKLDRADAYLDSKLPNFWIQNKIDKLGWYKTETAENAEQLVELTDTIEKKFSRLERFDMWVRENADSKENWYMQLASYLVKLPLRSAMNIVNILYGVIETILYTAVHPLKSINRILKTIVTLVNELGKPETWTKIGVGTMAVNLGQIAVFTNPISHMAMAIGATLVIAGLSFGALKAAIINEGNELNAAKDNIFNQFKELPECFLTALFIGMITGGIQKATTPRFSSYEEAKAYADKYVRKHGLPQYRDVYLHKNGKLVITWGNEYSYWGRSPDILWFRENYPKLFKNQSYASNRLRFVFPRYGRAHAIAGNPYYRAGFMTRIKQIVTGKRCGWWKPIITPLNTVSGLKP